MNTPYLALAMAFMIATPLCNAVESPESAVPAFLGEKIWTSPGWLKVRATCYAASGKCASGIKTRYATDHVVGTASVPYWVPKGSLIRLWTANGHRVYLAADEGSAVESRKAARKGGKDTDARMLPVIDFCAPRQHWPDQVEIEIFDYVGSVPFEKLNQEQKEQLMLYARRFI